MNQMFKVKNNKKNNMILLTLNTLQKAIHTKVKSHNFIEIFNSKPIFEKNSQWKTCLRHSMQVINMVIIIKFNLDIPFIKCWGQSLKNLC